MNVTVKLFGDLKRKIPDYSPENGLEMDIPEGSKVADLLALLGIPTSPGTTVIMEGRVLPSEEKLINGSLINLFHVMYGG
ncbi:MAG: MoaD/ThiS family protein [Smithellaceae bacterium]|jgi:sulfur carrier protein ThiS